VSLPPLDLGSPSPPVDSGGWGAARPPAPEYRDLAVLDDGNESDGWTVEADPLSWSYGWDVYLSVELAPKSMLKGILQLRPPGQDQIDVEISGWDADSGGVFSVPYPSLKLSFKDGVAPGDGNKSIVHCHACPRSPGSPLLATVLYGSQVHKATKGTTSTVVVPKGATHYTFAPTSAVTADLSHQARTTPTGGVEYDLDLVTVDLTKPATDASDSGTAWRRLSPMCGARVLLVINGDAVNDRNVALRWRFPLLGVR
jgi:hypothetical protein